MQEKKKVNDLCEVSNNNNSISINKIKIALRFFVLNKLQWMKSEKKKAN